MRALFLGRKYVEKSQKSGKSMVILDIYRLPRVKDDGTGELTAGSTQTYFITDPKLFDIGKTNVLGDIVEVEMRLNEQFNRGEPCGMKTVLPASFNLMDVIK